MKFRKGRPNHGLTQTMAACREEGPGGRPSQPTKNKDGGKRADGNVQEPHDQKNVHVHKGTSAVQGEAVTSMPEAEDTDVLGRKNVKALGHVASSRGPENCAFATTKKKKKGFPK